MEESNCDLINLKTLGIQNGWDQFEMVFSIKDAQIFNGDVFALMTIRLNVLNGDTSATANCTIGLRCVAIRDEYGNLLKKEREAWTYSDFLKVPFKVTFENCEKLGKNLVGKLLSGRMDLRRSLQNATYDVSKQVA